MINQMTKERREAYVEVLEVLRQMDKKYVAKIPRELREFFERNASKEYKFNIDPLIPLDQYKFKEITINVLAMINLNYWCESEEHKQELLRKYHENDIKREQALRERYNPDNLFKRQNIIVNMSKQENINNIPIQYEEAKWYQKTINLIVNFIKRLFNRV